jgi:magnesium transporter
MAETEDLSFAFLESHPTDAARVLGLIAPQNVGALFLGVPVRLAAPVLRAMLPLHVARCLEDLPDDTASGLLRAMGPQAGVAVLHYFPESRRNALLGQLPTALALAFRMLLGYPEDTVGAWMDPRALALPADMTAETVIARLRDAESENDTGIFVVGPDQRLLGQVSLSTVLRASSKAPLSKSMRTAIHKLPARSAMRAVEEHPGWHDYQILPVVEREDHFVGALDRGVLARALLRNRQTQSGSGYGDVIASVAGGYWLGVENLIQVAVAMLPVATPLHDGEPHER